jgi:hypothetical protein
MGQQTFEEAIGNRICMKKSSLKPCSIQPCHRFSHAKGMCNTHYERLRRNGTLVPQKNLGDGRNFAERFWSRVDQRSENECWPWKGAVDENGYGNMHVEGRHRRSHQVAWALAKGRQPMLDILHSCDYPACCNPKHLREGTEKDNVADMVARGRSRWQKPQRYALFANSRPVGVYFNDEYKSYTARVYFNKQSFNCGPFASAEEAIEARIAKMRELFGKDFRTLVSHQDLLVWRRQRLERLMK